MSAVVARRYFVRAQAALRRGDLDEASSDYRAAIELEPEFIDARIGYAVTLASSDAPRAQQSLRAGLTRATRARDRARLLVALGDVQLSAGDYRGADASYAEAETLGVAIPELGDRRARLHAKTGAFKDAFDALERAAAELSALRSAKALP